MAIIVINPSTPGGIQGAVTNASAGDVILVKKGIYNESVFIDKSNIKIIAKDDDVILNGNNQLPVAFIVSGLGYIENVEINGFTIRNYTNEGIFLEYALMNRIIGNKIFNVNNGIYTFNCFETLLWKNDISYVFDVGISLNGGINEILENNICECNGDGIASLLYENSIISNHCYRNGGNGIAKYYGFSDILSNNHCHNNNGSGISYYGAYNKLIDNHCNDNGSSGIYMDGFHFLAYNNKVYGNGLNIIDTGIIVNQDENYLIGNEIENNLLDGIWVTEYSNYGFFGDNKIKYNPGDGMKLQGDNNTIEDNEINKNQNNGLNIMSDNNFIKSNEIEDNSQFDIKDDGNNNIFIDNECKKSSPPNICQMCDDNS